MWQLWVQDFARACAGWAWEVCPLGLGCTFDCGAECICWAHTQDLPREEGVISSPCLAGAPQPTAGGMFPYQSYILLWIKLNVGLQFLQHDLFYKLSHKLSLWLWGVGLFFKGRLKNSRDGKDSWFKACCISCFSCRIMVLTIFLFKSLIGFSAMTVYLQHSLPCVHYLTLSLLLPYIGS